MKKLFLLLLVLVTSLFSSYAFAVSTGTETSPGTGAIVTTNALTILSVEPTLPNHIDVVFSQPIDIQTVRVTLVDQATKQNVRVTDYAPSDRGASAVKVTLLNDLQPNTPYILTVNTAMSLSNETISAGVDAIREFTTGAVPSGDLTLNAPSNPNIAVATGVTGSSENPDIGVVTGTTAVAVATGVTATHTGGVVTNGEELPATGPGAYLILLFGALVLVAILFTVPKRRA